MSIALNRASNLQSGFYVVKVARIVHRNGTGRGGKRKEKKEKKKKKQSKKKNAAAAAVAGVAVAGCRSAPLRGVCRFARNRGSSKTPFTQVFRAKLGRGGWDRPPAARARARAAPSISIFLIFLGSQVGGLAPKKASGRT